MNNTKKSGSFSFIIFKEEDDDYCAVCLELNLIEWGQDKEKLQKSITEAAMSYLQGVRDNNLPDEVLNNRAPQKYWDLVEKSTAHITKKTTSRSKSNLTQFFGLESTPYNNECFI